MKRIQYGIQIGNLKRDIETYRTQHTQDLKQLRDLRNDPKAIEKIARERYFMKADNEDVFVLSDDEPVNKKQYEGTK